MKIVIKYEIVFMKMFGHVSIDDVEPAG